MVLHHITNRTDAVVETAASFDTDGLAHGDLHASHVVAVPHRLQQGVGEPEDQEVFHALLAEVVVDAEDPLLGKHGVQGRVELDGAAKVATERLLDHDAAALVEADRRQRLGDRREHRGRNRHVEHGDLARVLVERAQQRVPRIGIAVIALDQVEPLHHRLDDIGVGVGLGLEDGFASIFAERLVGPVAAGDADDRDVQLAVALQVIQRGEQLSLGEIARGSEQHQGVSGRLCTASHCCVPRSFDMSTELCAKRRQDLVCRCAPATGGEPVVQRCAQHRCRHAFVDRGVNRPAALTAVGDVSLQALQLRIRAKGRGRQVDEPTGDHTAASPQLGDRRQIEVVLVVLRVGQRSCLGVLRPVGGTDVCLVQDVETLGEGRHHAVLDPVVDHLDEVAGAGRPAVQPAQLGRDRVALVDGRADDLARTWREVGEDRCHFGDRIGRSADHQRVAAVESEHATAGTDVDVVDADLAAAVPPARCRRGTTSCRRRSRCRPARAAARTPRWCCSTYAAGTINQMCRGAASASTTSCGVLAPRAPSASHRLDCFRVEVVGDAVVAGPLQAADHVGAHAPQTDHCDLHVRKVATFARPDTVRTR